MVENQRTTKCWTRLSTNCCTYFWLSSLCTCISIKSFIGLGSSPRSVVCKKKFCQLNIFINNNKLKNIYVIKINLTIRFICETNIMELSVCIVTKPWIFWLWFPAPDYDHHVKYSDIICWMYSAHIISWNPSKLSRHSSLVQHFFGIFFRFLLCLAPKITQPIWYKWIIYK